MPFYQNNIKLLSELGDIYYVTELLRRILIAYLQIHTHLEQISMYLDLLISNLMKFTVNSKKSLHKYLNVSYLPQIYIKKMCKK